MGNPLTKNTNIGTLWELLVQIRLLQYGVQAAPPLKDSGNDLIAIKGDVAKFIQIKTTKKEHFQANNLPKIYHILALVKLEFDEDELLLDESRIFLISKKEVGHNTSFKAEDLDEKEISQRVINELFI